MYPSNAELNYHHMATLSLSSPTPDQRPAFIGHSFGGATILHELSREAASSNGGSSARDSDYSMAFLMDPWNFPLSDEARGQTVRIPVRGKD